MKNHTSAQDVEIASSMLSEADTLIGTDWKDRFTATGRPNPKLKRRSAWETAALWGVQAPSLPPFRFTDDSIISVIVQLPTGKNEEEPRKTKGVPGTRLDLRGWVKGSRGIGSPTKIVKMPRGEYLKHFARDADSHYIGTEPERQWTEDDLDSTFSIYNDAPPPKWVVRRVGNVVFMEEAKLS